MDTITLDHAVEVVRALGPEEQNKLRALMDSWQVPPPTEATLEQQHQLVESLLAAGLLEHIPPDAYTEAARDRHEPVPIIGRPVSETLLEDRE